MIGDFNYPEICWELQSTKNRNDVESDASHFLRACKDSYLVQHQSEPTRHRKGQKPSLLDLVFSNKEELVMNTTTCASLGKSDHSILVVELNCKALPKEHIPRFIFGKGDYEKINEDLYNINWNTELDNLDIEEAWKCFKQLVDKVIDKHVPKSKPRASQSKKWMNKELLELVRNKHRTFRKTKTSSNKAEAEKEEKKAKNKCQRECKKARKKLEKTVADQSKDNPKPFWSYATSKLKTRTGIADLQKSDGTKTKSDSEKAEVLNSFFQSVFTIEPEGDLPKPPDYTYVDELTDFEINEENVKKILKNLQPGKASGPDGINPMFLAKTADSLALPITIIFRKSLADGRIPSEWRIANVSPIFKKGSKSAPNNYRPVSLTCILCKVMEKLVRKEIVDHLEANMLISDKQHGFVTGRSCITQLLDTLDIWTKILDDGGSVDAIYMDYQKAFDSVPHRRLVSKVKAHGISGNVLLWIQDFLNNRKQTVVVNGSQSTQKTVTSGIPQGSVLGPILFVLYINDLPSCVENHIRLFADDTKIFTRSDTSEATDSLQADLNQLQSWSQKWLLRFHPEKCHVLKLGRNKSDAVYKMNRTDLEGNTSTIILSESSFEKDLGVYVDSNLNFKEHVERTTAKANRIVGVIRRTFDFLTESMFVQLFKSLVRPILEYGNSAWQPQHKSLCQDIEDVQRRATKLLASIRDLSYPERLAKLKLPSLEHRRKRGDMIELYKFMHEIYRCDTPKFQRTNNETRSTRGHSLKLEKGHHRLKIRGNFFSVRVINTWNELPNSVVTAPSVNSFKARLDKFWDGLPSIFDPECYH